jgi:proteasome lid subunit RPN8/RPN11
MARLHAHLIAAYPEEGCGVLIGRDDGGARRVERVVGFANRHEEASGGHRYLLAPEQLLAAEREAREAGLDVVGFFHSHPDHPAHPSAFDLENAWPYYSYLIVSVVSGAIADTQAFRLADDRSRFDPEPVEPVAAAVGTE